MLEEEEEMESLAVQDTLDRKVRGDTPASPVPLVLLIPQAMRRKETPVSLEAVAFLASPDPEVTKVCQAYLVVRVCLDFLVSLSRVKDSQDSLDTLGNQEVQAIPDRRENLESWDSPARLDQGVMMVHLVSLAALENLVFLAAKVYPETLMCILEVQELKACKEIQATQVALAGMAPLVTTAFQEVQVSLEPRELLVKQDGLE